MQPLNVTAGSSDIADALCIRQATEADIPFLAIMMHESCIPPLNHCGFDDLVVEFGADGEGLFRGVLQAQASAWGTAEDAFILEEAGVPTASCFLYTPDTNETSPFRESRFPHLAEVMGWSAEELAEFTKRYRGMFPESTAKLFEPQAQCIIEYVAVIAEARGRGLIKVLLQSVIATAKKRGVESLGIMIINGNNPARHTYESLGFKAYDAYFEAYFEDSIQGFPGLTRFRMPFKPRRS